METVFYGYRFSEHFNKLSKLGLWPIKILDRTKRRLFNAYQCFWYLFLILTLSDQGLDLFFSIGNFKKLAYNLSTSLIITGAFLKVLLCLFYKKYLDRLRYNLYKDSEVFNDEEDVAIKDEAFEQLQFIRRWFYRAAFLFLPLWLAISYFSYLWGPRELPFAAILLTDNSKSVEYIPRFCFQSFCGAYSIAVVIETELAMFSIVIQIAAQYRILRKNISKLNDLYQDEDLKRSKPLEMHLKNKNALDKREVIQYVRRNLVKRLLRAVIIRQCELIEYVNVFESIFNKFMFMQIFGGAILIIMVSLQVLQLTEEVNIKLCYQIGYLALILIDILFICHHFTELQQEALNVGHAMYGINWYKMEPIFRRTVSTVILRSQFPPKITVGKLYAMDLRAYLSMVKNIYSWLMLFRQLELK